MFPAPVVRTPSGAAFSSCHAAPSPVHGEVMRFHPGAKPEFVQHVESRLAQLRSELPTVLPPPPARIVLEIGCGHGHFLARYAEAHPDWFCLGIDIINDRLERAAKKCRRAGLKNLHFHKTEATELIECLPADILLQDVFLLFPDPWPKTRHHKKRLVRPDFLAALARRMVPGGNLYFRTDHADYFAAGREVLEQHPDWQIEADAPWPFEEVTVFQLKAPEYQSLVASRRRS
jgi:tRNA (guanine-N7-)-methyltransferase